VPLLNDLKYLKMSNNLESLINKKKVEINKLATEISDLMDKLVFQDEGFKEVDSVIKLKTGRSITANTQIHETLINENNSRLSKTSQSY